MARFLWLMMPVMFFIGCTPAAPLELAPTATWSIDMLPYPLSHTYEQDVANIKRNGSIPRLQEALEKYEADTFAGLWMQRDQSGIVVSFTENGKQTIRRYVEGSPLDGQVEVRQAEVSLVELKAARQNVQAFMDVYDFPFESGTDIKKNIVEFYVTDPGALEAALEESQIEIPDYVALITVYEPLGDPPPFPRTPDPSIFLPQKKYASYSHLLALLEGVMFLENNCVRVGSEIGGESVLIIWEPDYYVNNNQGMIEILDRTGQVVAREGEEVKMGGGFVDVSEAGMHYLREPIPEACRPPHFIMGSIVKDE